MSEYSVTLNVKVTRMGVDLTESEMREGLTACLAVPRWVDDVVAAGPYGSLDELLEQGRAAATPLVTGGDRPGLVGSSADRRARRG